MPNSNEKRVAKERMKEIFDLAIEDEKNRKYQQANRKYELIHLYSLKYKTRVLEEAKTWICKKCGKGIYSGGGKVRLNKSSITISCNNCGYTRRIPISRRLSRP